MIGLELVVNQQDEFVDEAHLNFSKISIFDLLNGRIDFRNCVPENGIKLVFDRIVSSMVIRSLTCLINVELSKPSGSLAPSAVILSLFSPRETIHPC